jgi:hypothetical protein
MTAPAGEMTEGELLARAGRAMMKAAALPPRSLERSVQWAVYDTRGRARAPRCPLARREPARAPAMTGHVSMSSRIADAIAAWAQGQPRWTRVPPNEQIGASLDFAASAETFRVAKKRLEEDGVLFRHGGGFYVATPEGTAGAGTPAGAA